MGERGHERGRARRRGGAALALASLASLALALLALALAGGARAQSKPHMALPSPPPPTPGCDACWWPPANLTCPEAGGEMLPNPGASPYAFHFLGPQNGKNFITLGRRCSSALPRAFTIELWLYVPTECDTQQERLPIVSRFNPRLRQVAPGALHDAYNDFGLEIYGEPTAGGADPAGVLRFWMGGGGNTAATAYGLDVRAADPFPRDRWVHVAVAVVSSEARNPYFAMLYVDGEQVASANWRSGATRQFLSRDTISVGHYQAGDQAYYLVGVMDDLRLWGVPRARDDIVALAHTLLAGDERGLVALYRLDDPGGMIFDSHVVDPAAAALDANLGPHHGYTLNPQWTLGHPLTLHHYLQGVSGFPVEAELKAVDLVPTADDGDGFVYMITSLPEHGALFDPDDAAMAPWREVDLGELGRRPAKWMHYVCDPGYTGPDHFCYAARRANETCWSMSAGVDIECVAKPEPTCDAGDYAAAARAAHGDDVDVPYTKCCPPLVPDACDVCGGDNSTCTCPVYKTYTKAERDCILFSHAVNATMLRLESSINTLVDALDALQHYEPSAHAPLDLLLQIRHLCAVRPCIDAYNDELAVFSDYANEFLKDAALCPADGDGTVGAGAGASASGT